MSAINKEGMLVVFASPLENVPYTLAEVAVTGIPLLTFDVGGAAELIDPKTHEDIFCGTATVRLLCSDISGHLQPKPTPLGTIVACAFPVYPSQWPVMTRAHAVAAGS